MQDRAVVLAHLDLDLGHAHRVEHQVPDRRRGLRVRCICCLACVGSAAGAARLTRIGDICRRRR
jgi:hypothetical protein